MASEEILTLLREFIRERDWAQFHTPANLAKSISIEAAELLECFQWNDSADPVEVRHELADVLTYAYMLADLLGERPDEIVREKLSITADKYPVDKAHGRSDKYDRL
ncbi:nucleotide pyrophosphohydrolase [Corynebacterium sp. YIM 101645]|uniref:Nucleotide pyrophosphohydrolase n=1 Tax=Corynebacterium lemuris TaxID=1859292 RepID=A0ABT2FXK1_9CORY|nr:nucleotide pyrophosphohydrolase [Corynebacterium lemuris]MCS5479968.1 nucleotide pyrophosphohydrolase [Corynebacterium lemuris]